MARLRDHRKNVVKIQETKQQLAQHMSETDGGVNLQDTKLYRGEYLGTEDGRTIRDAGVITTNSLIQEKQPSDLTELNKQQIKQFQQKCASAGMDTAECKKMFPEDINREGFEKLAADYKMRSTILDKKFEEIDDDQKLVDYLMNNGRTRDEALAYIAKIKNDEGKNTAQIVADIRAQFKREREGVIARLRAQQDKLYKEERGKQMRNSDYALKLLNDRVERLRRQIRYHNIVSSYLELGDKDNNILGVDNTAILRELKESQHKNASTIMNEYQGEPNKRINDSDFGSIVVTRFIDLVLGEVSD